MITVDFDKIKSLLAVEFGYTPYFDSCNNYSLIRPKKTYKLIDKLLNPYVDRITFDYEECARLAELLSNVHLIENQKELDKFVTKVIVTYVIKTNLVIEKGRVTYAYQ